MPESAFWRFSLDFYARPGVADACLALQDSAGADVNVVLYLLFLAQEGRSIDAATAAAVVALARPWGDAVVVPLRKVRRTLRGAVGAFHPQSSAAIRSELKRIELAAERLLQETLESELPPPTLGCAARDRAAAAAVNLDSYARMLELPCAPIALLLQQFGAMVAGGASQ